MTDQSLLPLPVAPTFLPWRGHRLARYSAGSGQPALLVHSINAAASAFEMRAPFADLQSGYAVHALDLLGYGKSDRPARRYSAEDYVDQILTALAVVGAPSLLVASSLGAAYAILAAARQPALVRGLVVVCPTGIQRLANQPGPMAEGIYRVLRGPAGRAFFDALTSRGGVRLFLRTQAYHSVAALTPPTVEGFYRTCRAPGAHYAPVCFLTGLLNCAVREAFASLAVPTLIVWGAQATTTPVSDAQAFLAANPRAQLEVIDGASLLVQDERPAPFNALVRRFAEAL